MRIAQLIDSLTVGGAEKLQVMLARALRDRDVELTVVTLYPSRFGDLEAKLESLGVRVVALHASSLFSPLRATRLAWFLRRQSFDVLFTHLTGANILGPVAGRIAGVPTIATLHSVFRRPRREALGSWSLSCMATCAVAVGNSVARAHRGRLGHTRCEVIPNPVELNPPLPPAERLAMRRELIGTKEVMLVSVGRLAPDKGYPDLLAAFAAICRTHPGIALVIAGAGALKEQLHAQIESLKLRGHAHLIGYHDDVPRLLAAADAYVSSSHWEGLPLSVLEAMAAGLPVVATDVGDVRMAVVDGTGILVPPHEPAAFAAALRLVLDDAGRARAMGAAGRRHVLQNFGVDRWAERLLQLGVEVSRCRRRRSSVASRRRRNPDRHP